MTTWKSSTPGTDRSDATRIVSWLRDRQAIRDEGKLTEPMREETIGGIRALEAPALKKHLSPVDRNFVVNFGWLLGYKPNL